MDTKLFPYPSNFLEHKYKKNKEMIMCHLN